MMVRQGRLTMISAKSGHYKPGERELVAALTELRGQDLPIGAVKVRLYHKGRDGKPIANDRADAVDTLTGRYVPLGHSVPQYLSAYEFMHDAALRDAYLIWGL